ncbi:Transmembrane domain-containing protein [Orpheovirus IHUMI-LCC2]|uniref:Transmembrane domain-containing protein n=1 Tax=Orpheovirus IHUMI-LCC2 TaxID=2023057 RepID=A0A2I2L5V7_9VIRU|nr:Transmembrane domain-containing protein [Orpheovirus IHUMI-LCC2]SNW62880.1 Transmembrane domain-containing protein [Orpheovirus IHUMI-LCC2]
MRFLQSLWFWIGLFIVLVLIALLISYFYTNTKCEIRPNVPDANAPAVAPSPNPILCEMKKDENKVTSCNASPTHSPKSRSNSPKSIVVRTNRSTATVTSTANK